MRELPLGGYRHQAGLAALSIAIAGAALLLVLAAAVGGTYVFMRPAAAGTATEPAKKQPPPDPVFVAIKPFTVNLQSSRSRVLYIGLSLAVPDDKAAKRIETHLPQVRNRILMTLSDRSAQTLASQQGKIKLARLLTAKLTQPLAHNTKPLAVDAVLFTNFILQ